MPTALGNAILPERVSRRVVVQRVTSGFVGIAVGSVFYIAGFKKSASPQETLDALAYAFADTGASLNTLKTAVYALVAIEILVATSLVTGVWGRIGRIMAASLLVLFTAWLRLLVAEGAGIPCGCGLKETWLLPGDARSEAILRNALLLAMLGVEMGVRRWAARPVSGSVAACAADNQSVPVYVGSDQKKQGDQRCGRCDPGRRALQEACNGPA